MMEKSYKIFKIKGVIKHYDWGGKTFLPSLLQLSNEQGKPYAEYWLGSESHEQLSHIPYLFKVLDVQKMLSIQVHPSKKTAETGFKKENEASVPLDAAHRNYKDDNHKPELMSPLSSFYLLHGFKSAASMKETLVNTPELNFLLPVFGDGNYQQLYQSVMTMPQKEVNSALDPLLQRILPLYESNQLSKDHEDFWAARAAKFFRQSNDLDRGIFSVYLLNLVKVRPGEAVFQDSGLPHAYLEGQTMEIMANSDNVLRGGLTPKHIDVDELLKNVKFEPTIPGIIQAVAAGTGETVFQTPATDFQLSRIILEPNAGISVAASSSDIFFVSAGRGMATADEEELEFRAGDAFASEPGTVIHFRSGEEVILFRAAVPATM